MSVDHITVSKLDEVDSPSEKETNKIDEEQLYQSRIKNLGAIPNEDWHKPEVTNTSNHEFIEYTNECYFADATLFNPSKKPKTKHLSSITLGWMYNRKGGQKGKDFKCTRVLIDSWCGGTLVNRSFVKNTKRRPCQNPPIELPRQALSRQIARSNVSLP
jgi:hypothetical protein